ncbi:MAG: dihydrodipicolinate synthase family protein [Ktedonobacteraceae bacterium]|nr:dihydrodipicolinate synthase family protein [Ktedonobacteraceae bacterium]
MKITWRGVIPAITTRFHQDYSIDHAFFADHCRSLVDAGCVGLITPGSLGESATLSFQEKIALLETAVHAVGDRVPVICGVAALSTAEAVRLAYTAQSAGCSGLMVLPPYVYSTDWREMKAHVATVIASTSLPTILYNNPPAYSTDFLPEQIAELARENANLEAVKESSADVRRITALRVLLQGRLELLAGVDDCIVESIQAGAVGWVAGLANAFPKEAVALFDLAMQVHAGKKDATSIDPLYTWFLPLLRLDTGAKFVQYIKLAQEMAGAGSARVRAPRLELADAELETTKRIIQHALDTRPSFPRS